MSQKLKSITIDGQRFEIGGDTPPAPAEWTKVEWNNFLTTPIAITQIDSTKQVYVSLIDSDGEEYEYVFEFYNLFELNDKYYSFTFYNIFESKVDFIKIRFTKATKTFTCEGTLESGSGILSVSIYYR